MEDSKNVLMAVTEFLLEVNPRLPPYWYSVLGDGAGSLSYLFGMSQASFICVLLAAGVLKKNKDDLRFQEDTFVWGFNEMMGCVPKGIEASANILPVSNQRATCGKSKPRRETVWFIRVGSSTASTNWKVYKNAHTQIKDGTRLPRASLNLSRRLFMECDVIYKTLLDKKSTQKAESAVAANTRAQETNEEEARADSPDRPSIHTTNPVITPSAVLTVQEYEVEGARATPFLDDFVGERDKQERQQRKNTQRCERAEERQREVLLT